MFKRLGQMLGLAGRAGRVGSSSREAGPALGEFVAKQNVTIWTYGGTNTLVPMQILANDIIEVLLIINMTQCFCNCMKDCLI